MVDGKLMTSHTCNVQKYELNFQQFETRYAFMNKAGIKEHKRRLLISFFEH